jgi:hypothetical protein
VKLGLESRKKTIAAAVLGGLAVLVVLYQFIPSSSNVVSSATPSVTSPLASPASSSHPPRRGAASTPAKKVRAPQSLDPTLNLQQLAATEQIKYEGSGRNIFVSQAEEIPKPIAPGATDTNAQGGGKVLQIQPPPPPPPIPLKFFGFANHPGEPKKIFLSKGDDVFIAGEGEIVDRRYKVLRISPNSVEIQDVIGSGPPQSIPLTQG